MEPLAQLVQDSEGAGDGGLPGVDQLSPAVVGGDDLPGGYREAALLAGPVPPLHSGCQTFLLAQRGRGEVRQGGKIKCLMEFSNHFHFNH